jgi:hypothetical protein
MLVDLEARNVDAEEPVVNKPPIPLDQTDTSNIDPVQVKPETITMYDAATAELTDPCMEEIPKGGSAVLIDGAGEVQEGSRRRYRRTAATSLIGATSELEMAPKPPLQPAGRKPPSAPRKFKKKAE